MDQFYSNDGPIELRESNNCLQAKWIVFDLESIAPQESALLMLSGPEGRYVIQTNGIIRPVKCPRDRMAFSVRGPHSVHAICESLQRVDRV